MSSSWAQPSVTPSYPFQPPNPAYPYPQPTPLQLEEANRRLMMHTSQPFNQSHTGVQQFNQSHSNNSTLRKPVSGGQKPVVQSEFTVAVYTFSHEKEPMPYRIRIPTKPVTLKAVKDLLPKKGAFRFFFKTEIDGEACYEEESEDSNLVPLWEGKVLVQCRIME